MKNGRIAWFRKQRKPVQIEEEKAIRKMSNCVLHLPAHQLREKRDNPGNLRQLFNSPILLWYTSSGQIVASTDGDMIIKLFNNDHHHHLFAMQPASQSVGRPLWSSTWTKSSTIYIISKTIPNKYLFTSWWIPATASRHTTSNLIPSATALQVILPPPLPPPRPSSLEPRQGVAHTISKLSTLFCPFFLFFYY